MAIDESVMFQREIWEESEKESFEIIKNAGVEVFYPDKSLFSEKVKPMYENYRDEKEVYSYIERIINVN